MRADRLDLGTPPKGRAGEFALSAAGLQLGQRLPFGSLGTSFTLKSKHDDDGPGGSFVVGEEFEIHTNVAGQIWTITFADNGKVFFTGDDVSTTTGIREQHPTANQPGVTQHMTADARNHTTGETIHGFLDVLPVPACGG